MSNVTPFPGRPAPAEKPEKPEAERVEALAQVVTEYALSVAGHRENMAVVELAMRRATFRVSAAARTLRGR